MYRSKYFSPAEFRCKGDECKNKPDPVMDEKLLILLDKIRERVGKPVIISCGYRCPVHNKAVGGVKNSFHQQGVAADIYVKGVSVEQLAKIAENCGADCIGRYYKKGFVHVDVRGYKARWEG